MTQNASNEPHVTIIGSGVGGLCMAMRLIHAGHTNFGGNID